MSMPLRPADQQLANIIDKLAEFVARNGQQFEDMTKLKQQNNEKFNFLKPGMDYNNYYQYKVVEEKRKMIVMPQSSSNMQSNNIWSTVASNGNSHTPQVNVNLTAQIEAINTKQMKLKEQIIESEKNLNAQHQVLLQHQKTDIEEALSKAQLDYITRCAQENEVSLTELDEILQPIIDSCTKDSIIHGKASILQQATNSAKRQIISQYILKKAMAPNAVFTQKLHLIYLINDLLHHCVKKNADDLKNSLESVVIPMFCNATISANDEQKEKLGKLLNLWASKANFFDTCALSKLSSPASSLQEYHNTLLSQYSTAIAPLNQAMTNKFDDYRNQHKTFVEHATNQLTILEAQKQSLEQQQQQHQSALVINELAPNTQQIIPSILNNVNMLMNQNRNEVNILQSMYPNQQPQTQQHNISAQNFNQESQNQQQQPFQNFNLPPPNFSIPDFSRPPPGFNSSIPNINSNETNTLGVVALVMNDEPKEEVNLTPTMPYFDLPAGLMVPLIRLEDFSYHGIDAEKIQLPPPSMPTDKLLSAIEAFYSPPSHERPRDNEGWEKLGLYEYFKIKNAVKKQKEEAILRYEREKSKSPSPIPETLIKPMKKLRKRIYNSQSPEKRSKSRSVSPEPKVVVVKSRKQRSRSPLSSPIPYRFNNRESRNDRNNRDGRNERSKKRSVTPPSFSIGSNKSSEFIDEGNKGHLMLKKMGWESGGLGSGNQGIVQPISGGEIRDRTDMYKGVGMNMNDPFENFRKNRSNNFITRMKSRSDTEKN